MIRRSKSIICTFALMLVGRCATAQAPPARDFQQWTTVAAAWEVKPKLAISTFGEVHFGNDVSQFDQELLSAGIVYSPSRWVSLGTGYLYLHANPHLSGINYENRIYVEATFKAPSFRHFLLSDGIRPELRWEQAPAGSAFTQRYRNRVILERPIKKYVPFVMWERFYGADVKSWNRARYYGGVNMPIDGRASMELYFMRQNDAVFRPFHKTVVGASFMFHFESERERHHPHE